MRWQRSRALWSWLRAAVACGGGVNGQCDRLNSETVVALPRRKAKASSDVVNEPRTTVRPHSGAPSGEGAVLLPFPIHGEALLIRLADLLRSRVSNLGPTGEPFLFLISRCPQSRLLIDRNAYIDFVESRSEFRLAIDVAPNTEFSLRTADFDALVDFVVRYVSARLAESPVLEAAS